MAFEIGLISNGKLGRTRLEIVPGAADPFLKSKHLEFRVDVFFPGITESDVDSRAQATPANLIGASSDHHVRIGDRAIAEQAAGCASDAGGSSGIPACDGQHFGNRRSQTIQASCAIASGE